jgi:hypothetical protein
MRLASHVVGLADPLSDLVVELVLVPEHELVDPVGLPEELPPREPRRVDPPLEPEAEDEAVLPEPDYACEPHPHHERDPGLRRHLLERPNSPTSETHAS